MNTYKILIGRRTYEDAYVEVEAESEDEAAQKAKEQSALWNQYKQANEQADPYQFMNSPENKAITRKYEQKLKQEFPKYFDDKVIPPYDGEVRQTRDGGTVVRKDNKWVRQ